MKQKQLLHQEKATAMLMHFNSCNFASKICDVDIKKSTREKKVAIYLIQKIKNSSSPIGIFCWE